MHWVIERLAKKHDRSAFDCGQTALNDWLLLRASQFEKKDLARTFVAVTPTTTVVNGFYALAMHHVRFEVVPEDQVRGLPKIDIPVVLLGRLAVDVKLQGLGLGEYLLMDALRRTEQLSQQMGIRAVEVDAIDDRARIWYLKFGFVPLLDDPHHLFLPLQIIRKLELSPIR